MIKVKIFEFYDEGYLESEINRAYREKDVIDVKYSIAYQTDDGKRPIHSAMIIYNE